MRPVVIWGTGGLSESVYLLNMQSKNLHIVAFCASSEYCTAATFLGLPLIADDDLESRYPPNEVELLVCLGFKEMNRLRTKICDSLQARGYSFCNYIHPSAIIHDSLQIGWGNIILEGVIIGTNCKIGNGNIVMEGSLLSHNITLFDYCYVALGVVFGGFVQLKNNCFVGLNATLLPYVTLAEKTLVGAGTVIAKDSHALDVYSSAFTRQIDQNSTDIFAETPPQEWAANVNKLIGLHIMGLLYYQLYVHGRLVILTLHAKHKADFKRRRDVCWDSSRVLNLRYGGMYDVA